MARAYTACYRPRIGVSLLGKVYLGFFLALLVVGLVWASVTLQSNSAWIQIQVAVPRADIVEPLALETYEINLAVLITGWMTTAGILVVMAMRAPFKIRVAATVQRRIKELEREVLELRTLPLRQQEEDDLLAADAHIELGSRKVMTEQLRRDVPPLDDELRRVPAGPTLGGYE